MYIHRENIPVVPLYFAREREVVVRGEQLIPLEGQARLLPGETPRSMVCRFRTLGCSPCTGAVKSSATSVEEIIGEMMVERISERFHPHHRSRPGRVDGIEEAGGLFLKPVRPHNRRRNLK